MTATIGVDAQAARARAKELLHLAADTSRRLEDSVAEGEAS